MLSIPSEQPPVFQDKSLTRGLFFADIGRVESTFLAGPTWLDRTKNTLTQSLIIIIDWVESLNAIRSILPVNSILNTSETFHSLQSGLNYLLSKDFSISLVSLRIKSRPTAS